MLFLVYVLSVAVVFWMLIFCVSSFISRISSPRASPMVFTSFLSDEISVLNILVLSDEDVEEDDEDAMDLALLGFSVVRLLLLLAIVVVEIS